MNSRGIIKKIENTNWYRQGGAILPYYPAMAYRAVLKYFDGFSFTREGNNYGYFDREKQRKISDTIIKKQIKDRNYVTTKIINPWRRLKQQQNNFTKKITTGYLSKLLDKDLFGLHKKFNDLSLKLWKYGIFIEAFDPWGHIILNQYLSKHNIKISPHDLAILIGPRKLTFLQRELLDRFKISKPREIRNHAKKYHWIASSWGEIRYLDEKYFSKLIKNRGRRKSSEYPSKVRGKIAKLEKKYKLPAELKNLFYFFSAMTDWRDERKAQAMRINHQRDMFLKEFSKRTGIPKIFLAYLEPQEFANLRDIRRLKANLKLRPRGFMYYLDKNLKVKTFVGQKAHHLNHLLEKSMDSGREIRGTTANRGKARGKAKIIVTKSDFSKMKKGDIIVSQMTRPEFTPILNKAAGIVTDEGGVTCHAAIVSRELGIPCIIGTQVATSVFKDGDIIEVDAYEGIVRKIK